MLNRLQAQAQAETFVPGSKVKAWTMFQGIYLFRMKWPMPGEEEMDPFLSVDPLTAEVRDFSILTDLTLAEFDGLKWAELEKRR